MSDEDLGLAKLTEVTAEMDRILTADRSNQSELKLAWRFLQVYATWGLRLPVEAHEFQISMGVNPVGYDFYVPMQQGNELIKNACTNFMTNVFDNVLDVGMSLRSFAKNVSNGEGEAFAALLEVLDEKDKSDAFELIQEVQDGAAKGVAAADKARIGLADFNTQLTLAVKKIDLANISLNNDSKTNDAALAALDGPVSQEGSLAWLHAKVEELGVLHTEATAAAATSPLYCWVLPPLGLIATGAVMGVYTDKAIGLMKEINNKKDLISKGNADLLAAQGSRDVYKQGKEGLEEVVKYTEKALDKCRIVKNAWLEIIASVDELDTAVKGMTKETDEGKALKTKRMIKRKINAIENTWSTLLPKLNELMSDPYIRVESETKNLDDMIKDYENAAA